MKNLTAIFFTLLIGNSLCQKSNKLETTAICDSTLRSLLDEFSENRIYTPEEAKEIGTRKANCDLANGTRRIIVFIGMFNRNFCEQCYYSELGFLIERELVTDIVYPNDYSHEFTKAYNEKMNSTLDSNQLSALNNPAFQGNPEDILNILDQTEISGSKINDSIIRIKITNRELEKLFSSDLSNIKVTIKTAYSDTLKRVYPYSQLMNDGVEIQTACLTSIRMTIGFNLEDVPERIKICWCKLIENEFRRGVIINIK